MPFAGRLVVALALAAVLVAGCLGAPSAGGGSATTPDPATSTTTATTTECTPADLDASRPDVDHPGSLTQETAADVAESFEYQYQRARLRPESAEYAYFNFNAHPSSVSAVDGGYRVTFDAELDWGIKGDANHTEYHGHKPYTVRFTVTDRGLERNGRTVACW